MMISEAELRRSAARAGVDPMVIDLDYALGWFLAGLFSQTDAKTQMIFKGGTCLRKCYFGDYRFSEDLDFTLTRVWPTNAVEDALRAVQRWSAVLGGPDFAADEFRVEVISDDYGEEAFQAWVYYRGPLRWGGPARAIRLDISRGEYVAFPSEYRSLLHDYSDGPRLPAIQVRCYSMAEMLAEKIRAICGQRRFAIARDLYDIYHLSRSGVALESVNPILRRQFSAKGVTPPESIADHLNRNRQEFALDWERRLTYLLPNNSMPTFTAAWDFVLALVSQLPAL
jgi:predicted nucleotidyltransferase component of viral defense system